MTLCKHISMLKLALTSSVTFREKSASKSAEDIQVRLVTHGFIIPPHLTESTKLLKHNTIRTSKKRTVFAITCYFCRSSLIALVIQIRCLTLFIKGIVDEQSYIKLLEFCVKFGQMFRIYTQEPLS